MSKAPSHIIAFWAEDGFAQVIYPVTLNNHAAHIEEVIKQIDKSYLDRKAGMQLARKLYERK